MIEHSVRLLEKIAMRVDASGGPDACHPWTGGVGRRRCLHPVVAIGKDNLNPRRVVREVALGTRLEPQQRVRDTCGNLLCCNPRHLKGGTLADRLEAQVDKSAGPEACWPWRGYTLKGYGRLRTVRGTPWVFAHRLAYALASGVTPPPEVLVCHRCDNPPCCNPAHLFLGSHTDNALDMWTKGRGSSGDKHGQTVRRAAADRAAGIVKVRRPPGRPRKSTQVSSPASKEKS